MIKFHCPSCDKKLRTPDDWAARRIKCPDCGERSSVPSAVIDAVAPDVAGVDKPLELDDSRRAASAPVEKAAAPAAVSGRTCPSCGQSVAQEAVICVNCGRHLKLGVNAKTVLRGMMVGKAGAGVAASAVGAVAGGALWAGIVVWTGYEVGYVAWFVGILAGLGIVLFAHEKTGPMLGAAAASMAVVGLLLGKLLIVQWGIAPQAVNEIVADNQAMIGLVLEDMADKRQFSPQVMAAVDEFGLDADRWPPELAEQAVAAAFNRLGAMSDADKQRIAEAQVEKYVAEMSHLDRIKAASSLFDLLWGCLAIASAWGLGNGTGGDDE
jgi:hypothetical protein